MRSGAELSTFIRLHRTVRTGSNSGGEDVDSIRSFDAQSQRSIEEVKSLTVYPATEIVLSEERISQGLKKIEAEYQELKETFHKAFETDKEVRLTKEYQRIREELSELSMLIGVEGYLPLFL